MGPFIANHDTPFADMPNGKLEDTLHVLAITRLMQPNALLPATTALGSINKTGREQGILLPEEMLLCLTFHLQA